jgi:hypothetical protein
MNRLRKSVTYAQWTIYYSAIKKNEMILFAGKWMKVGSHVKRGNSGSEGQRSHIFHHMQKLDL